MKRRELQLGRRAAELGQRLHVQHAQLPEQPDLRHQRVEHTHVPLERHFMRPIQFDKQRFLYCLVQSLNLDHTFQTRSICRNKQTNKCKSSRNGTPFFPTDTIPGANNAYAENKANSHSVNFISAILFANSND